MALARPRRYEEPGNESPRPRRLRVTRSVVFLAALCLMTMPPILLAGRRPVAFLRDTP